MSMASRPSGRETAATPQATSTDSRPQRTAPAHLATWATHQPHQPAALGSCRRRASIASSSSLSRAPPFSETSSVSPRPSPSSVEQLSLLESPRPSSRCVQAGASSTARLSCCDEAAASSSSSLSRACPPWSSARSSSAPRPQSSPSSSSGRSSRCEAASSPAPSWSGAVASPPMPPLELKAEVWRTCTSSARHGPRSSLKTRISRPAGVQAARHRSVSSRGGTLIFRKAPP
mmetsp:Transcript_1583/g.5791  ORF Transcript_1583/g.5791 Transcript_1583/m.5791 type:complete len:232 (+) Transcript_1583:181-876(+)